MRLEGGDTLHGESELSSEGSSTTLLFCVAPDMLKVCTEISRLWKIDCLGQEICGKEVAADETEPQF